MLKSIENDYKPLTRWIKKSKRVSTKVSWQFFSLHFDCQAQGEPNKNIIMLKHPVFGSVLDPR